MSRLRRLTLVLRVFLMGFREADGNTGMTWDRDDTLTDAYDHGRTWGRRLRRIEED